MIKFQLFTNGQGTSIIEWLTELFGEPQVWGGEIVQPVQLKKDYRWAHKRTVSTNTVWCDSDVFMLYRLKWGYPDGEIFVLKENNTAIPIGHNAFFF